jgi:hypothetical protein
MPDVLVAGLVKVFSLLGLGSGSELATGVVVGSLGGPSSTVGEVGSSTGGLSSGVAALSGIAG